MAETFIIKQLVHLGQLLVHLKKLRGVVTPSPTTTGCADYHYLYEALELPPLPLFYQLRLHSSTLDFFQGELFINRDVPVLLYWLVLSLATP